MWKMVPVRGRFVDSFRPLVFFSLFSLFSPHPSLRLVKISQTKVGLSLWLAKILFASFL